MAVVAAQFSIRVDTVALDIGTVVDPLDSVNLNGYSTYRLYVRKDDVSSYDEVVAVGNDIGSLAEVRTTGRFYQHPAGSFLAQSIQPLLPPLYSGLAYDSWLTIGIETAPDIASGQELLWTTGEEWTVDFEPGGGQWGGDLVLGESEALFLPAGDNGSIPNVGDEVLIGQFTTSGQFGGQLWVGAIGGDDPSDFFGEYLPFGTSIGCLDSTACNYNPAAVIGSCRCVFPDLLGDCGGSCNVDVDLDGLCDSEDDCRAVLEQWQPAGSILTGQSWNLGGPLCLSGNGFRGAHALDTLTARTWELEDASFEDVELSPLLPDGWHLLGAMAMNFAGDVLAVGAASEDSAGYFLLGESGGDWSSLDAEFLDVGATNIFGTLILPSYFWDGPQLSYSGQAISLGPHAYVRDAAGEWGALQGLDAQSLSVEYDAGLMQVFFSADGEELLAHWRENDALGELSWYVQRFQVMGDSLSPLGTALGFDDVEAGGWYGSLISSVKGDLSEAMLSFGSGDDEVNLIVGLDENVSVLYDFESLGESVTDGISVSGDFQAFWFQEAPEFYWGSPVLHHASREGDVFTVDKSWVRSSIGGFESGTLVTSQAGLDALILHSGASGFGLQRVDARCSLLGCTDETACNYFEGVTEDDGSCVVSSDGSCDYSCVDVDDDGVCDTEDGCTDLEACNYFICTAAECGYHNECGVCEHGSTLGGDCNCPSGVLDALGECDGPCELDANANGICDDEECVCGPGTVWDAVEGYCIPELSALQLMMSACGEGTYWDMNSSTCLPIQSLCPEDLNDDDAVTIVDLLMLLSAFGAFCSP